MPRGSKLSRLFLEIHVFSPVFSSISQFAFPFFPYAIVAVLAVQINDECPAEEHKDHRHFYHFGTVE